MSSKKPRLSTSQWNPPVFHWKHVISCTSSQQQKWLLLSDERAIGKIIFTPNHLDVLQGHSDFRGMGLGRMLFAKMAQTMPNSLISLEAEEDTHRYGQLVRYYQSMGCRVLPNKEIYLQHNDGTSHRKVFMEYEKSGSTADFPIFQATSFGLVTLEDDGRIQHYCAYYLNDSTIQLYTTNGQALVLQDDNTIAFSTTISATNFQIIQADPFVALVAPNGHYFTQNHNHTLQTVMRPRYWKVSINNHLMFTRDSPVQYQHRQLARRIQTPAYVEAQHARYMSVQWTQATLYQVLKRAASIQMQSSSSSLQQVILSRAQQIREDALPDWMQLLGLFMGLSRVVLPIDEEYDWTVTDESWWVAESCLAWTDVEYLYHILRLNQTTIPEEGLDMMRYAFLKDDKRSCWDWKELVEEYDINDQHSELDLDTLWDSHYLHIAAKYSVDHTLAW